MQKQFSFRYINIVPFQSLVNWSASFALGNTLDYKYGLKLLKVGKLIQRNRTRIEIQDNTLYRRVTIKLYGKGVIQRDEVRGNSIGTKNQFLISEGQFIMSKIDARNGAFGIVPKYLTGAVVTQDFLSYDININLVIPDFFLVFTSTQKFLSLCQRASSGTTGRQRVNEDAFLNFEIAVPSIKAQGSLLKDYDQKISLAIKQEREANAISSKIENRILTRLGVTIANTATKKGLNIFTYKEITKWSVDFILKQGGLSSLKKSLFPVIPLGQIIDYLQYGISEKSNVVSKGTIVLRMNNIQNGKIDLEKLKHYDFESSNLNRDKVLLQKGDLLFNRTNSKELVGKTAVFDLDGEYTFASYLIRLRFNKETNPYYVNYILNSRIGRLQLDLMSRQILGQANINSEELKEILLPFPSLEVQNKIVKELNELINKRETLLRNAEQNRSLAIKGFEKSIFTV